MFTKLEIKHILKAPSDK